MPLIKEVVAKMRSVLEDHIEHMIAFRETEKNIEGWFKGEMIVALRAMKAAKRLADYKVEQKISKGSKRSFDFVLAEPPRTHVIENKTWLIGEQRGSLWDPHRYLFCETGKSHREEMDKLLPWQAGGRYLFWFCYANPGQASWDAALQEFRAKFPQYRLTELTKPQEYPVEFFIGVLQLK